MSKDTSITLGNQLNQCRFGSATRVVRAGLGLLEENEKKQSLLRNRPALGEKQADRGSFLIIALRV